MFKNLFSKIQNIKKRKQPDFNVEEGWEEFKRDYLPQIKKFIEENKKNKEWYITEMKKTNFNRVYEGVSLEMGIPVEEVKWRMQEAVISIFESSTKEQKIILDCVPRKGEIPTPEELIYFIFENLL